MDKLRSRLLICLILIFAITAIGFLLSLFSSMDNIVGSSIQSSAVTLYLPGMLFMGFMILSIFYLEKS